MMTDFQSALEKVFGHFKEVLQSRAEYALAKVQDVAEARSRLVPSLPDQAMPLDKLTDHILSLTQGFSNSSLASTYYGFVTGGTTQPARLADLITGLYDQSAAAHLPEQSIATDVEDRALILLQELLEIDSTQWKGRCLTTGATAGNIQGLALGRESIINRRLAQNQSVGELGLLSACKHANIEEIKVLSTNPHSSLQKAASIVGLGRDCYINVRVQDQDEEQLAIDSERLEQELKVPGRASIVAVSCGEVNTGNFATKAASEIKRLRDLCDKYGAWLHVDGAFGIFARLLSKSGEQYRTLASGAEGVELADSIAGDLHKFLNVPYDCGFFMFRDPSFASLVYTNPNASYLKPGSLNIPSPLNIRAENSARFRGFSVYGSLVGLGRQAYIDILQTQVDLSRNIARFIDGHPKYELLNGKQTTAGGISYEGIFMIVLFRAKDPGFNETLAAAINAERRIFVSGTGWQGGPACRIAVSNWQAAKEDFEIVREVLNKVTQ